jgi:nitric oxide reductase NorQ protein
MTKNIYYKEIGQEKVVFKTAFNSKLPVLLKGPTGCGKSRFIEAMAQEYDLPMVTVCCNDETSSTDLLGRYLITGGETIWQDGPVTRAVRNGGILYLDEIAEARDDVITVLHSLSDHRRELYLDRKGETLTAPDNFILVVSFNPGYQQSLKEMKPSTRQRFVSLSFNYPDEKTEIEIVNTESNLDKSQCKKLVKVANKIRNLHELGLAETVSTRLLIGAAKLMQNGLSKEVACEASIIQPLSDDPEVIQSLKDITALLI